MYFKHIKGKLKIKKKCFFICSWNEIKSITWHRLLYSWTVMLNSLCYMCQYVDFFNAPPDLCRSLTCRKYYQAAYNYLAVPTNNNSPPSTVIVVPDASGGSHWKIVHPSFFSSSLRHIGVSSSFISWLLCSGSPFKKS